MIEIEDKYKPLYVSKDLLLLCSWNNITDEKERFEQFILHQKCLLAAQFIDWHGVRREIVSLESITNIEMQDYEFITQQGNIETRREYTYNPPIEKSNHGPTRSLCVSKSNFFLKY